MLEPTIRAEAIRLFYAEHFTMNAIADSLGIHHDTVKAFIHTKQFSKARVLRSSMLDPYRDFIEKTLSEHPRIRATRLHHMLRDRGFKGSVSILRDCVRKLRPRHKQAFMPLDFLPGQQNEQKYFLTLVQLERAGTQELKAYFQRELQEGRERETILHQRITVKEKLNLEDSVEYYSEWHYAAIHMLVTISRYQTIEALQKAVGLPVNVINDTLQFLCKCGLVKQVHDHYEVADSRVHIPGNNSLVLKHHINWRVQALQSLQNRSPESMHYTSVVSLSQKDVENIKFALIKAIEGYNDRVKQSAEEECWCLNLDFFNVIINNH